MIQITEKQALDMLETITNIFSHRDIIKAWKEAGYIQKSKLDLAREIAKERDYETGSRTEKLINAYEEAIKELIESNE